jgi:hypothetical protein
MSRLVRTLLFTLVAAWLPVTLHCRLEAAGLFESADACCAGEESSVPDTDCKDDACPTVEDALYKESAHGLNVAAPEATDCFACLALVALTSERTAAPTLSPPRHGPPPELRVAWQFVTRAAPPARAPSLNS